jgi:hypothetical protein
MSARRACLLERSAVLVGGAQNVSAVDDQAMLMDALIAFIQGAIAQGKPFMAQVRARGRLALHSCPTRRMAACDAQVSFHSVHIPYVAPPQYRAM